MVREQSAKLLIEKSYAGSNPVSDSDGSKEVPLSQRGLNETVSFPVSHKSWPEG